MAPNSVTPAEPQPDPSTYAKLLAGFRPSLGLDSMRLVHLEKFLTQSHTLSGLELKCSSRARPFFSYHRQRILLIDPLVGLNQFSSSLAPNSVTLTEAQR